MAYLIREMDRIPFNLSILECKLHLHYSLILHFRPFNLSILECKRNSSMVNLCIACSFNLSILECKP